MDCGDNIFKWCDIAGSQNKNPFPLKKTLSTRKKENPNIYIVEYN